MARVIVVFESMYGNTKRVAEAIIEGMHQTKNVEATLATVKEVDLDQLKTYDAILIGSPNHIGGPTRAVKGFIDKLGKLRLEGKGFAVFDTYLGRDFEKAVKKMEKRVSEKASGMRMLAPGLSIEVQGMKGPIVEDELPKCVDFGKKIAEQLES